MKKRNPKFWFKNEKELMKILGMKGTPGSGNRIIKEDGQNEHLIAQLKTTEGSQITIKLQDVTQLLYNATITHKVPLFINQFLNGPILLSIRLEDLEDVYKYLTKKITKERFCDIIELENDTEDIPKKKIISNDRLKVKKKLEREKQKKYERRNRK